MPHAHTREPTHYCRPAATSLRLIARWSLLPRSADLGRLRTRRHRRSRRPSGRPTTTSTNHAEGEEMAHETGDPEAVRLTFDCLFRQSQKCRLRGGFRELT